MDRIALIELVAAILVVAGLTAAGYTLQTAEQAAVEPASSTYATQ